MKKLLLIACLLLPGIAYSQICDIKEFLDECPTNDPNIDTIMQDFEIRLNDTLVTDFPCTEPISDLPIEEWTQPLIYLQTLRTIYYMSKQKNFPKLPWTDMNLYDWMKSKIDGIDIVDGTVGGLCCQIIDGKTFVVIGNADEFNRNYDRTWIGIAGNIDFLAHETRHADGNGHLHSSCCGIANGCDSTYNINDLGSYGVQYWLNLAWLRGDIDVGVRESYTTSEVLGLEYDFITNVNTFRDRICDHSADSITLNDIPQPFGRERNTYISATICSGETYSFKGKDLTKPGDYTETYQSGTGCDSLVMLHLQVNDSAGCEGTGITDNQVRTKIRVYPNPFKNKLQINFGHPFSGKVQLLDMQGTVIKKDFITDSQTYEPELNIPAGIYVLVFISDDGRTDILKVAKE